MTLPEKHELGLTWNGNDKHSQCESRIANCDPEKPAKIMQTGYRVAVCISSHFVGV
jgi:hypothetical protein